jgi:plasmid stability protein
MAKASPRLRSIAVSSPRKFGRVSYSAIYEGSVARSGRRVNFNTDIIIDSNAIIAYIRTMASITIRNLENSVKAKLRVRAARHSRSMEEEARNILRAAVAESDRKSPGLCEAIRQKLEPFGDIKLELPPRGPGREPPDFPK